MNPLTIQNRVVSFFSGLGTLVGKRTSEALIMTRILSVFKILKRVGFAVLCLHAMPANCLSQNLDTLWTRLYGGEYRDYPSDLSILSNGDIVTVGFSELELLGDRRPYIVCTHPSGELAWETRIDSLYNSTAVFVSETNDQNVIAGVALPYSLDSSEFRLFAWSLTGDFLWNRTYVVHHLAELTCCTIQENGSIYLVGRIGSDNPTDDDVQVIKVNQNGTEMWREEYDLQGNSDWPYGVTNAPDGGIAIVGRSVNNTLGPDGFFLRLDVNGGVVSTRFSSIIGIDQFNSITATDTAFLVAAYHPDLNGFGASALLLDESGGQLWRCTLGTPNGDEEGAGITQLADGRVVMTGYTRSFGVNTPAYSNLAVWVLAANGDSLDMHYYGGNLAERGIAIDYSQEFGTCYVAGRNTSAPTSQNADFWLLRLDSPTDVSDDQFTPVGEQIEISLFPNPTNGDISVLIPRTKIIGLNVSVFNVLGQELSNIRIPYNNQENLIRLEVTNLPSGVYFVSIPGLVGVTQSFVIQK